METRHSRMRHNQYLNHEDKHLLLNFILWPAPYPLPVLPASYMATSSCPGCLTSDPTPCLQPGKAVKDDPSAWNPVPVQQTRKKLLAPHVRSAQLQPLWPFRKGTSAWKIFLSLLFVNSAFQMKTNKSVFKMHSKIRNMSFYCSYLNSCFLFLSNCIIVWNTLKTC